MVDRMNLNRIIGLFLVFVVIGSVACARESKVEGPAAIRDQTGDRTGNAGEITGVCFWYCPVL